MSERRLYEHERRHQAIRDAAPELYEAVSAFVVRIDSGARADTDYVIRLMDEAIAKVLSTDTALTENRKEG